MENLMREMNMDTYHILRQALELGKWETGKKLTNLQKKQAMQLIILFERANKIPEQDRVGYIETTCDNSQDENLKEQVINFK